MDSNVVESILDAERRLETSRQILGINIQQDNIQAANELLLQQKEKRSSKRISSQLNTQSVKKNKVKKNKVFSDTITIAGLKGTLGENLARLGEVEPTTCAETQYFSHLSKNGIIDLSILSSNSQLTKLGGPHVKNYLIKDYLYTLPELDNAKGIYEDLGCKVKKARGSNIADIYDFIDIYKANSPRERAIKDVYKHITQQHAHKGHMLSDEYFSQCSELSTITKYWSPIFESYLGEKRRVFIQWGDTLSIDCKNSNLNYKLDLRLITDTEKGPIEAVTGEFASTKTTLGGKLYSDKLKSVLTSKCHLNALLKKLNYLPQSQVKNVHIPILQIMGQNVSLFVLSLIDKQVYSVQNIMSAIYPRTLVEVRAGGIKKLIDLLSQVEYMIEEIEDSIKNYSRNTSNKMKDITGNGKLNREFEVEAWVSNVEWDTAIIQQ
ncbi:hypothetical protein BDF14DRAFT_1973317 [Spinellus fusiger]|nr:hypothetical protein BDF14DRAFT_1973317 [Spinellus fusiger]